MVITPKRVIKLGVIWGGGINFSNKIYPTRVSDALSLTCHKQKCKCLALLVTDRLLERATSTILTGITTFSLKYKINHYCNNFNGTSSKTLEM